MSFKRVISHMIHWFCNLRYHFIYFIGGKIVGARALVIRDHQTLLISHTYTKGWFTIGGGVDRSETPAQAIKREVLEEVGVIVKEDPQLFNVYHNTHFNKDDYIFFYIIQNFEQTTSKCPEIEAMHWFPLNNLPPDVSASTQRRIDEYLKRKPISNEW